MRAACREYLGSAGVLAWRAWRTGVITSPALDEFVRRRGIPSDLPLLRAAQDRLRQSFGVYLAQMAVRYGIDIADPLSDILPLDSPGD
jgi:hypothetical protein